MKIEYDPLGRRITKTVGETVYHYTWSGDQLIEIRDGDGNLLKFIIYGNNLDEPIVMMGSATTYYFTTDGLGSISEITDEYGGLEEYYTYDAYGSPSLFDGTGTPISTSAVSNPFYFTGREYDFETGIYYYRARYYDPGLGRFLETDPLGYIDSPNLYAYVGNNPINWLDPFGLKDRPWPFNGEVHNKSDQTITSVDIDNRKVVEVSSKTNTSNSQDIDFVKVGDKWYKIGPWNFDVDENGQPDDGFREATEQELQDINNVLDQNKNENQAENENQGGNKK